VGVFPNPTYVLRPGQFARVRAKTQIRKGALAVPQRAVTELQGSYQVAVVDSQNKVHLQAVTVGDQVGSDWVVEKGLEPGQEIVVEGTQKVKEGAAVSPQPFVQRAAK
jgi:membrane fusion protein (multidrug efflux system)